MNEALEMALSILDRGSDEGPYDEEAQAVRDLIAEHERSVQELEDFKAILNDDADGRMILNLRQGVEDPCALCGWTLKGHKYIYWVKAGPAHLHCSHTLRQVEIEELKAQIESLAAPKGKP